jgi:hypothetical protein
MAGWCGASRSRCLTRRADGFAPLGPVRFRARFPAPLLFPGFAARVRVPHEHGSVAGSVTISHTCGAWQPSVSYPP